MSLSFADSVNAFAHRALIGCDEVKRTVAVDLGTAVIESTPVSDEETSPGAEHGFLQGNWQAFIDAAPDTTITWRPKAAAIEELQQTAKLATGDDTIILRNNTIYGPRIEFEGWSHTKAPAGMVRINVQAFEQTVNDAALKVRGAG